MAMCTSAVLETSNEATKLNPVSNAAGLRRCQTNVLCKRRPRACPPVHKKWLIPSTLSTVFVILVLCVPGYKGGDVPHGISKITSSDTYDKIKITTNQDILHIRLPLELMCNEHYHEPEKLLLSFLKEFNCIKNKQDKILNNIQKIVTTSNQETLDVQVSSTLVCDEGHYKTELLRQNLHLSVMTACNCKVQASDTELHQHVQSLRSAGHETNNDAIDVDNCMVERNYPVEEWHQLIPHMRISYTLLTEWNQQECACFIPDILKPHSEIESRHTASDSFYIDFDCCLHSNTFERSHVVYQITTANTNHITSQLSEMQSQSPTDIVLQHGLQLEEPMDFFSHINTKTYSTVKNELEDIILSIQKYLQKQPQTPSKSKPLQDEVKSKSIIQLFESIIQDYSTTGSNNDEIKWEFESPALDFISMLTAYTEPEIDKCICIIVYSDICISV